MAGFTSTASAADPINVVVDGKQVEFGAYGAKPEVVDGRTMVPIRAVVETMGATVEMGSDSFTIAKVRKSFE